MMKEYKIVGSEFVFRPEQGRSILVEDDGEIEAYTIEFEHDEKEGLVWVHFRFENLYPQSYGLITFYNHKPVEAFERLEAAWNEEDDLDEDTNVVVEVNKKEAHNKWNMRVVCFSTVRGMVEDAVKLSLFKKYLKENTQWKNSWKDEIERIVEGRYNFEDLLEYKYKEYVYERIDMLLIHGQKVEEIWGNSCASDYWQEELNQIISVGVPAERQGIWSEIDIRRRCVARILSEEAVIFQEAWEYAEDNYVDFM